MPPKPPAGNGELEPRAIFGGAAAFLEKRSVDLLNVNAAVLDSFNGVGDFQQPARCLLRISMEAISGVFHWRGLSRKSVDLDQVRQSSRDQRFQIMSQPRDWFAIAGYASLLLAGLTLIIVFSSF